jgi:Protein of unknown function (DUF664)
MSFPPPTSAEDVIDQPARAQFEVFLDEHRSELNGCLDGLSEEQVRRSLVPSRTTLLGLVKHATFVEKVWFDEAVTCRSRAEIGIPATPDESFILDDTDTIATVRQAHREACESSRRATSSLGLDDMLLGNRPSDRSGGQLSTTPSAVNSTRTRVVTARRPWRMTTGTGKFRSGGTIALLVSDGPGLLTAR